MVADGVGSKQRSRHTVGIEYLGTKLACGVYASGSRNRQYVKFCTRVSLKRNCSRDIAVDDLCKGNMATVCDEVEGLRLYTRRAQSLPFQVFLCDLSVGDLVGGLDGLDGSGAIDGFLRPGDIGQAVRR